MESAVDAYWHCEDITRVMEAIVIHLETKLHEWKPETSQRVRALVTEIIELADNDILDIGRTRESEQEVLSILDTPV